MEEPFVTVEVAGKPAGLVDAFVIRVPYRIGAIALVAVLGTVWGLQYATAKMVSLEGVGALETLFVVHLALAGIFAAVLLQSGKRFRPTLEQVAFFAIVSLLSNLLPLGVELFAAHHVSAGELALIISLTPIAVLFFAFVLQSETMTTRKTIGVLAGCIAGGAILVPDAWLGGGDGMLWTSLAFLGPAAGGLGNVLMAKHWPAGLDPLQVATGNLVAGVVLLVPMVVLLGSPLELSGAANIGTWAVLGFGFTVGMEFYLMALITRLSGAAFASCSDFIAICAGLGWGYLFFTEVPTAWMIAAACLCMVALRLTADGVFSAARVETELA